VQLNHSVINNTLPNAKSNSAYSTLSSDILAENSVLRTENDCLKRELHSQYSVSAFTRDDRNHSANTSTNGTSRAFELHDKLYTANRNLQSTLL
jgi:hypothetical protein